MALLDLFRRKVSIATRRPADESDRDAHALATAHRVMQAIFGDLIGKAPFRASIHSRTRGNGYTVLIDERFRYEIEGVVFAIIVSARVFLKLNLHQDRVSGEGGLHGTSRIFFTGPITLTLVEGFALGGDSRVESLTFFLRYDGSLMVAPGDGELLVQILKELAVYRTG